MKEKSITIIFVFFFSIITLVAGCSKKGSEIKEKVKETGTKTFQKFKRTVNQDDLLYLKNKINTYKRQNGRYPASLQQLVNEGFVDKIPEPPTGMQYEYDPSTGKLSLK